MHMHMPPFIMSLSWYKLFCDLFLNVTRIGKMTIAKLYLVFVFSSTKCS